MSGRDAADVRARADRWRSDLEMWRIPQHILDQAPESPWIHPVEMFTVESDIADSPSHRIAREAVPPGGSVLDVGCGGGRAGLALVPPAGTVIGVDHQQAMLDSFAEAARARGAVHHEYRGDWPQVADEVPKADVVVCHHVAYNVGDIVPFLEALNAHAKVRVVLEVPVTHPLSGMNPLWSRFWDLERPTVPRAQDLAAILQAMGFDVHCDVWIDETWGARVSLSSVDRVRYARARLCLTEDRDAELAAALLQEGDARPREVATIWWDVP